MKWKYCNYCPLDGTCENQYRGHECEMPIKKLCEENQQLKELLKKCIKHFDELLLSLEKADVKHFVGIPYYPSLEFVHYLKHIDNAIGEKK